MTVNVTVVGVEDGIVSNETILIRISGEPMMFAYTQSNNAIFLVNKYFYLPLILDIKLPSLDISGYSPGLYFNKKDGVISGNSKSSIDSYSFTVTGQDFYTKYLSTISISIVNNTKIAETHGIAANYIEFANSDKCVINKSFVTSLISRQEIISSFEQDNNLVSSGISFDTYGAFYEFNFIAYNSSLIYLKLTAVGGYRLYINSYNNLVSEDVGCFQHIVVIPVNFTIGFHYIRVEYSGSYMNAYIKLEYSYTPSNFTIVNKYITYVYGNTPAFMNYLPIHITYNTYISRYPNIIGGFSLKYNISNTLPKGIKFNTETGRIYGTVLDDYVDKNYCVTSFSFTSEIKYCFDFKVRYIVKKGIYKSIRSLSSGNNDYSLFQNKNEYFRGYVIEPNQSKNVYPYSLDNSVKLILNGLIYIHNNSNIYVANIEGKFLSINIGIKDKIKIFTTSPAKFSIKFEENKYYDISIVGVFNYTKDIDTLYFSLYGLYKEYINEFYYVEKQDFYYQYEVLRLPQQTNLSLTPILGNISQPDWYNSVSTLPNYLDIDTKTGIIYGSFYNASNTSTTSIIRIYAYFNDIKDTTYIYTLMEFKYELLAPPFAFHFVNFQNVLVDNIKFMLYENISNKIQSYIIGYYIGCKSTLVLPEGIEINNNCDIYGKPTVLHDSFSYYFFIYNTIGGIGTELKIEVAPCIYVTSVEFSAIIEDDNTILRVYTTDNKIYTSFSSDTNSSLYCISENKYLLHFDVITENSTFEIPFLLKFSTGDLIKKYVITEISDILVVEIVHPPFYLEYKYTDSLYYIGIIPNPNLPSYTNKISLFSINPSLPAGLTIDVFTGIISGKPEERSPKTVYNVRGCNSKYCTSTKITIQVEGYGCYELDDFPATEENETCFINCNLNEYGYRSRSCIEVDDTPTWDEEIDNCTIAPTKPDVNYIIGEFTIVFNMSMTNFTLFYQYKFINEIKEVSDDIFYNHISFTSIQYITPIESPNPSIKAIFTISVNPQYINDIVNEIKEVIESEDFSYEVFDKYYEINLISSHIYEYHEPFDYVLMIIIVASVLGILSLIIGILIFCKITHRLHCVNPKYDLEYYLPFVNSGSTVTPSYSRQVSNQNKEIFTPPNNPFTLHDDLDNVVEI